MLLVLFHLTYFFKIRQCKAVAGMGGTVKETPLQCVLTPLLLSPPSKLPGLGAWEGRDLYFISFFLTGPGPSGVIDPGWTGIGQDCVPTGSRVGNNS